MHSYKQYFSTSLVATSDHVNKSGQWYVNMWLLGELFKGCQVVGKGSFCPLLLPASCLECKHYGWSSGSHPVPWSNVKNGRFWLHQGSTIPALNCLFLMMMMMIIFYQWEKYTMYLFIVNAILKWYNKCFSNISIVQIHLRPYWTLFSFSSLWVWKDAQNYVFLINTSHHTRRNVALRGR